MHICLALTRINEGALNRCCTEKPNSSLRCDPMMTGYLLLSSALFLMHELHICPRLSATGKRERE